MKHPASDEALMAAWRSGDPAAFRALFLRLAPTVRGIARRCGLDPQAADDAVQRTFLALHEARDDFRPEARLRPWFFTIAYNVVRQELRRRGTRREVALPPELLDAGLPDQGPRADARDTLAMVALVRDAVAELPGSARQVIELHWFHHLPYREVAQRLGASEGAVRVRAHRGYEVLRAALRARAELWEPA